MLVMRLTLLLKVWLLLVRLCHLLGLKLNWSLRHRLRSSGSIIGRS